MKLSKNGWGVKTAIGFCCVFIFCLLLVVILVNTSAKKLQPAEEENLEINPEENAEYNESDYYADLEDDIYNSAKEYIEDNKTILEKEYFKLNADKLLKNGYITSLEDNEGSPCTGYIEIFNKEETTYSVYLKCPDYTSVGYDERKSFDE